MSKRISTPCDDSGIDMIDSMGTPVKRRRTEQVDEEIASTSRDNPPRIERRSRKTLQDSAFSLSYNASCQSILSSHRLAGRIESIQTTNFMCHSNLEIPLNLRINFITGRNGSGKSAIVAALVVVLGGTARLTGRGDNVSGFIKKGETSGKVSITLMNEGLNAYRKEDYGPRIIITRQFTLNGANSYTIKSATGHVISKKKEEVERIKTAFCLQIKNPVCILNQDVARSFLTSSNSSLTYDIFMKATELEDLKILYEDTFRTLNDAHSEWTSKVKSFHIAKEDIKELKKKMEKFLALEGRVKQRTALENELMWAFAIEEEKTLEQLESNKQKIEDQRDSLHNSELEFTQNSTDLNVEIENLEEKVEEANEARGEKYSQRRALQGELQSTQRNIDNLELTQRQIIDKHKRQLNEINIVKASISEDDESNNQLIEERNRLQEQLEETQNDLSSVKERSRVVGRDRDNANDTLRQYRDEEMSIRRSIDDLKRSKQSLLNQIEGLKNQNDMNVLKFGNYVPHLLEAIEQAYRQKQFKKKPIGPCGMFIKLAGDAKWAAAVETSVGNLMRAFCCDNPQDALVLSRIMERVITNGRPPSINTSKFLDTRHDTSRKEVHVPGMSSVLDVLQFDNTVVFNTFVDQLGIESKLLIETDDQAAVLLNKKENVPTNLTLGITQGGSWYYPAPNYKTFANKAAVRFFNQNTRKEDVIKKIKSKIQENDTEIVNCNSQMSTLSAKVTQTREMLSKAEHAFRSFKQEEMKLAHKMQQLRDEIDSRPMPSTKVALEEEIKLLEHNFSQTVQQLNKINSDINELKQKKLDLKEQINVLEREEQESNEEYNQLKDTLEEIKSKQNHQNKRKESIRKKVEDVDKHLVEIVNTIEKQKKTVEEKIKDAADICSDRINTDRSSQVIQKELEKLEHYIKAAEKLTGTKENAIAEYKAKSKRFETIKKQMQLRRDMITFLTESCLEKENKFKLIRSSQAQSVCNYFQAALTTRGYDGTLNFDFGNSKLEIEVTPKDESQSRKDTKTLSGGERSYATVSFILAIWHAIEMPIYVLDEFDVFMDKVNRRIIMELLLENAEEKTDKQFIFITPQDISNIKQCDTVSIYKMPDPERSNQL